MRAQTNPLRLLLFLAFLALLAAACIPAEQGPATMPTLAPATPPSPAANCPEELSAEACATLGSLTRVDDYPLYTMRYYGGYGPEAEAMAGLAIHRRPGTVEPAAARPAWGCSLFAAMASNGLFGRNFDWQFSPAVLLFTDPPGGYATVTMVDIGYLVEAAGVRVLDELPLAERLPLLEAPLWPFDGLNEHGLAVGMAAVPAGQGSPDPARETIDSLLVIRKMLDGARNVDEALAIFRRYNIDMGSGPPLHYLIADRSGRAVLVEFYQGELIVSPNEAPWHQATNFLRASVADPEGQCWRHDLLSERLAETKGALSTQEALALLEDVSQANTQWSIVYDMAGGRVSVAMNRRYQAVHHFRLEP